MRMIEPPLLCVSRCWFGFDEDRPHCPAQHPSRWQVWSSLIPVRHKALSITC